MRRIRVKRPSAGVVIAFVALVAALSGTAVALPGSNSVNSGDIKNSSITSSDVKNNSLKSTDIKNGSLVSKDFKSGQLPAGATGPAGPAGPAGAPGSALAFAHVLGDATVDSANTKNVVLLANPFDGIYCLGVPAGSRSITGTADYDQTDSDPVVVETTFAPGRISTFGCPAGTNALALTNLVGTDFTNEGFYIVVN
jgi:hypothetical protein